MIKFNQEKEASKAIMDAMKSGDENAIQQAWAGFHNSIAQQVIEDFREVQESQDAEILAQRGYRQLTSKETKWYQKLINAMSGNDWKQKFTTIIGTDNEDDLMPETIIEDVYRHLVDEHPLLSKINFQYTGYITKWIVNDHTVQTAVWGEITDAISKEITSAFKVIDVNQNKLSAYAFIENGMLDLGPTFLDGYIRTCLTEALALGLETGIISGTGLKEPAGLTRDIQDSSFTGGTGYREKTAVSVTSFAPAEYGALVAKMAKTEKGRPRKINKVTLICNQNDYLTKIMPATTVLTAQGTYANNLFPFPTEVIISNVLADGKAVLALLDEYSAFAGGRRNGVIEYSDEFKFLDDVRYFKIKQYATGKAFDNTCSVYLDISALTPAYITVKNLTEGSVTVSGEVTTIPEA